MASRLPGRQGAVRRDATRSVSLADQVLRLIWRERQVSRAEIARLLELSRSTVSEIVAAWLRTKLVAEVGAGRSNGGRRPIVLEFQDSACFALGVELGATHVGVVQTDLRGRTLAWYDRAHPVRDDPDGTRALVAALCDACLDQSAQPRSQLVGIGIAVPSPVDQSKPDALSEVVLPAWGGRSGFGALRRRYQVPLWVDNDANLGALAEHWWGVGAEVDDFAYIKIATGVGSGHVIGGQLYRGATGVAGEIGHLAIDPHGGPCVCGLRGCLTTKVGGQALVERTQAMLGEFPDSVLNRAGITLASIEDAALAGDALALQVCKEAAEYLGIAIAGMLNLMNPTCVIVGGGLARLGELLLAPLREMVKSRTLVSSLDASEIHTSDLGPRAVAIGAATLAVKAALDQPRLFPAATATTSVPEG